MTKTELVGGYNCYWFDGVVTVEAPSGKVKLFRVNVDAPDSNIRSFMNSLTEDQLKGLMK